MNDACLAYKGFAKLREQAGQNENVFAGLDEDTKAN